MKRTALLPALFLIGVATITLAWLVPGLSATSSKCLIGCGKGQKPPACCNPPPCEFMYELSLARADVRAVAEAGLTLGIGEGNPASYQEFAKFLDAMSAVVKREYKKFAKCSTNVFYQPTRPVSVDKTTCKIGYTDGGTFHEQTLEGEQAANKSCSELVDAEYRAAQIEQAFCTRPSNESEAQTNDEYAAVRRLMAEAKINALEQSVTQFWKSCKAFKDPKVAESVAKAGVDALKEEMPSKPAKKTAKRAAGSRRGR
jgi:hypothetical protein